eukprot:g49020.t1
MTDCDFVALEKGHPTWPRPAFNLVRVAMGVVGVLLLSAFGWVASRQHFAQAPDKGQPNEEGSSFSVSPGLPLHLQFGFGGGPDPKPDPVVVGATEKRLPEREAFQKELKEAEASCKKEKKELKEAKKELKEAEAKVEKAEAKVEKAKKELKEAKKELKEAEAKLEKAKKELEKAEATGTKDVIIRAKQMFDMAVKGANSAQAGVDSAQAGVDSAQAGVDSAQAGVNSAQAGVNSAQARVNNAQVLVGECILRQANMNREPAAGKAAEVPWKSDATATKYIQELLATPLQRVTFKRALPEDGRSEMEELHVFKLESTLQNDEQRTSSAEGSKMPALLPAKTLLLFDLSPALGIALITRRPHAAPLASFARYQAECQVGGAAERIASSSAPRSVSSWTHLWDAWVGYESRMAGVFGPSVAPFFAKTRDRLVCWMASGFPASAVAAYLEEARAAAAVGRGPPAFGETGRFPQAFATLSINACTSLAAAKARRQGGQFATPRRVSGFERNSKRVRRDFPTGQHDLLPRDVFDSVISKLLCAAFNRGSCGALGTDGQPVAPNSSHDYKSSKAAITVSQAAAPAQPAAVPAAPIAGRAVGSHRAIISSPPPPIVSSRPLISSPASRLLFPSAVPFVGFSFWPGRAPSRCLLELPSRRCGISLSSLQRLCFSQWRAGRSSESDYRPLTSVSDECRSLFLSIFPEQDRLAFLSLARLAPDVRRAEAASVSSELVSSFGLRWSGEPVQGGPDRLQIEAILADLWCYIDPLFLDLAVDGLVYGANLCFNGDRDRTLIVPSYASATGQHAFVQAQLDSEIAKGWLAGWFSSPPFPAFRSPPLGTVAKDGGSDLRIIVDSSAGGEGSLNGGSAPLFSTFPSWPRVCNTIYRAHSAARGDTGGKRAWMIKFDVEAAFRQIPIRPQDWPLCVLHWAERWVVPLRLTFGARVSPGIWERFGFILEALLRLWLPGRVSLLRWVDDFLLAFAATEAEAAVVLDLCVFVAERYGFPLKASKLLGPAEEMEFIGWSFRISTELEFPLLSLPARRREGFMRSCDSTMRVPSRKGLEKLLGKCRSVSAVFLDMLPDQRIVHAFLMSLPSARPTIAQLPLPVAVRGAILRLQAFVAAAPSTIHLRPCTLASLADHAGDRPACCCGLTFPFLIGKQFSLSSSSFPSFRRLDGLIAATLRETEVGRRAGQLLPVATALISFGIADSSRNTYIKGVRYYLSFLTFYGLHDLGFPPSPPLLIFFMAFLFLMARGRQRQDFHRTDNSVPGAAATSLLSYLSGVRSLCVDLGVDVSAFSCPRVARAKRALKRLRARATRSRLPITIPLACRLLDVLASCSVGGGGPLALSERCIAMLRAAVCVGIYALLRSGELVAKSQSASSPLRRRHILWDSLCPPRWVDIVIDASKSDWCRAGRTLRVFRNGSRSCPVVALEAVWALAVDQSPLASLLQDDRGKPLTYSWLQSSLRALVRGAGLNGSLYASHSLRIGGATSLAMLGISPDTIRHMGRWKSLSYQLYVRITDDAVRAAQAGLGALGGVQGRVRRGLGWQAEMFGGWPVERAIAWSVADLEDVAARFNGQYGGR